MVPGQPSDRWRAHLRKIEHPNPNRGQGSCSSPVLKAPSAHQWLPNVHPDSADAHDVEDLRYGGTNLFVLPASGLPSDQVSELIDGYRFWIDRAAQAGIDWIILDTASLLKSFTDVAPLAPLATEVLFVHDQAISSKAQVHAALNLIRPMLGADVHRSLVMNRQSA
jgi:MinD-like ATPase involved in chromosome partitioning or flagellar assembly